MTADSNYPYQLKNTDSLALNVLQAQYLEENGIEPFQELSWVAYLKKQQRMQLQQPKDDQKEQLDQPSERQQESSISAKPKAELAEDINHSVHNQASPSKPNHPEEVYRVPFTHEEEPEDETEDLDEVPKKDKVVIDGAIKNESELTELLNRIRSGKSAKKVEKPSKSVNQFEHHLDQTALSNLSWIELKEYSAQCKACQLCHTRDQNVFSNQPLEPSFIRCLFLTDMPSYDDDRLGLSMSGKAGNLFNNMLHAIGLNEEEVVVSPLLKCRPTNPDQLTQNEFEQCHLILKRQIELLNPECIVALGNAAKFLLNIDGTLNQWRQQKLSYQQEGLNIPVIATYNPNYLLVHQKNKAEAWQDFKKIASLLS